ncbi:MAG: ATP-binding protein [Clostridia bacterium]|nr:ATP-binding protein [Clostridia bacterium]
MKEFTVKFNLCDSEYMTALRLVCGAVCSVHGLNVDDLEDFKVCVTESAIILKNCGFCTCTVLFKDDNGLVCEVTGEGGNPKEGETELSLALISALVSDCEISRRGEVINKVTLKV